MNKIQHKVSSLGIKFSFLISLFISITISAQTIVYVDFMSAGSPKNGTTWTQAYQRLDQALAAHQNTAGDVQIWVANGVYYPTTTTNRNISFQISRPNLTIAGGFAGGETSFSQRNITSNVAILSGNIGSTSTSADNSHCVVSVSNAAVNSTTHLMGLRISDGFGTIAGAGMQVSGGFLNVTDCMFYNNISTDDGGGVLLGGSSGLTNQSVFSRCTFRDNTSNEYGGGVSIISGRSAKFKNCLFYNNNGVKGGGGLMVGSANAEVINCTFTQNECTTATGVGIFKGGGILFYLGSGTYQHTLINSIIVGNTPFSAANPTQVIRPTNWGTYTNNLFEGPGYGINVLTFNPALPLFGTSAGPYCVDKFCSQAYNEGTTFAGFATETDILGRPRSSKGQIDLGAYEFQFDSPSSITGIITCAGANTGEIAIPTGGSGAQYYLDQTPFNGWGSGSSGRTFPNLAAGKYYTAIRQGGCTDITPLDSATIVNPPVLSFVGIVRPIKCNNYPTEVIVTTITGGYGSVQKGFRMDGGTNFFTFPYTFSGLTVGVYTITAFQGSCSRNYFLSNTTQPSGINVGLNAINDAKCFGQNSGSIKILVSGAIPPYTYSIAGISVFPSSVSGGFLEINNLSIGTKTLTVQDANGCTVNSNNFTINQPSAALVGSLIKRSHISCNGLTDGIIVATAAGGTLGYSYSISGISTSTVNLNTISGLSFGSFGVVVSDFNNCKNTITGITITTPSVLQAGTVVTNNLCSGLNQGAITMTGIGGTPPYQYNMDGGSYQSSRAFTGLFQGTFILRVKDANNCEAVTNAQLVDPLPFGIAEQKVAPTCNGNADGKLLVTLTGGTGNLSTTVNGQWFSGNFTATGLTALQQYQLRIQDQNGCLDFYNTQVPDKAAITLTGAVTKATCDQLVNDWILTYQANGGNGGFTYKMNSAGVYTTNNVFSNLTPSTVVGFAQDTKGCVATVTSFITPSNTPLVASFGTKTDVLCFGNATGGIQVNVSGGTSPYEYSIDNGSYGGLALLSGLNSGSKSVKVKDASNCIVDLGQTTISQPNTALQLSLQVISVTSIQATAIGGTGAFSYRLNNGQFSSTDIFASLSAGTYTVETKDANGCIASASAQINPISIVPTVPGTTTGLNNSEMAESISIYPNPTEGILYIKTQIEGKIQVVSATGAVIFESEVVPPIFDVTLKQSGLYVLKYTTENGVYTQKIIVK